MELKVSADLAVWFENQYYDVSAVKNVMVGDYLEVERNPDSSRVCVASLNGKGRLQWTEIKPKQKHESWVEFKGETCCYLREDSRLDLEVANNALTGLHAMLLDLKTSATKSWGTEELADIIGCISEKLARAINETEEINRAA